VLTNVHNILVNRDEMPLVNIDYHHSALSLNLNTKVDQSSVKQNITINYNFFKANFYQLYEKLCDSDWSSLKNCNNVEEAINIFYDRVNYLMQPYH